MSSTSSSGGTYSRRELACWLTLYRYKYLQKPLEESALPTILQYIHKWSPEQKDKLAITIGLLMAQGLATASCLQALTKDHLLKNGTLRQSASFLIC